MAENNGAWIDYPDYSPVAKFFRANPRRTREVTVKSGQVLLAGTFVQSIVTGGADKGKVLAHTGLAESVLATFEAITAAQTVIIAGLTWTAGGSGTTALQLEAAWKDIAAGTGFAALSAITAGGTFTAGTMTGYDTFGDTDEDLEVVFTSTTALTDVADLAVTGTGAAKVTLDVADGATTFAPIAGVIAYDVNASAADVVVQVFTEASFWASWLRWAVNPNTDTMTLEDGTTIAVTQYNTGAFGNDEASSKRLQLQFTEASGFEHLGFSTEGELGNG